ncbi:MAG TPA: excalibur calcium-binding domain-containing protein [Micromonosporaceae bacterium]|nr:excalibur calcium-binding domain-containing protein [Micromonosporaceae bacterium]
MDKPVPPWVWAIAAGAAVSLLCCGIGAFGPVPGSTDRSAGRPPEQPAFREPLLTPATPTAGALAQTLPSPPGAPPSATGAATTIFFADCAAARVAGAAPIPRGAEGYRPVLDPDGDGVACEEEGTTPATPATSPSNDPRFENCKQAKANGYGPYVRGRDAEYYWYNDPNRDGVVCD